MIQEIGSPRERAERYVAKYGAKVFLGNDIDISFPKEVLEDLDRQLENGRNTELLFELKCIALGVKQRFTGMKDLRSWNQTDINLVRQLCSSSGGAIGVNDMIVRQLQPVCEGKLLIQWWVGFLPFYSFVFSRDSN